METKTFNKFQLAMIKNVAKLTSKNLANKEKLLKKIADLQRQLDIEQKCIDGFQTPVKELTGGFTTEDLVDRVIEDTGKMDPATGKAVKVTKFVFKYPKTILPPTENNAENNNTDDNNTEVNTDSTEVPADADPVADPFSNEPTL